MRQKEVSPTGEGGAKRRSEQLGKPLQSKTKSDPQNSQARDPTARRPVLDRANSARAKSNYPPGADYLPSEESLARRQEEVLELLKEVGSNGITKLEAPEHLCLGLAARIHELRRRGFRIDTLPEQVGDSRIAKYVWVSTASRSRGTDENGDAT